MTDASSPASRWAATVSPQQYVRSRHQLDRLIVSSVPTYARVVDAELAELDRRVSHFRSDYDAAKPGVPRRTSDSLLLGVYFVGTIVSFAVMAPGGGRTGVPVPIDWYPVTAAISAVVFVLAVAAQLVRSLPFPGGVPPREPLAWFAVGFGTPTLAWMAWIASILDSVSGLWPILMGIAVVVSLVYCIARVILRRRNPRLTKRSDAAPRERAESFRSNLLDLADRRAEKLRDNFAALPDADREALTGELMRAAGILQARQLLGTETVAEARQHTRIDPNRRGLFPGYLLLAHRVEKLDAIPRPRGVHSARWAVANYLSEHIPR